jgi:hypothetical protein
MRANSARHAQTTHEWCDDTRESLTRRRIYIKQILVENIWVSTDHINLCL